MALTADRQDFTAFLRPAGVRQSTAASAGSVAAFRDNPRTTRISPLPTPVPSAMPFSRFRSRWARSALCPSGTDINRPPAR